MKLYLFDRNEEMKQQIYKEKEQKKGILLNLIGQQGKVNMLNLIGQQGKVNMLYFPF